MPKVLPDDETVGEEWSDLSEFVEDMESQGYTVERTTKVPKTIDDASKALFLMIQPEQEKTRYLTWEIEKMEDHFNKGSKLLFASYDGKVLSGKLKDPVNFYDKRLYDLGYDKNIKFIPIHFELDLKGYDLLFSEPTALWASSNTTIKKIGESSEESFLDINDNGRIESADSIGPFVCGYLLNDKSRAYLSNGAIFTDDLYDEYDNKEFVRDLIKQLLPDGGKIVIEETIHSGSSSPYQKYEVSVPSDKLPCEDQDGDGLPDVLESIRYGSDPTKSDTDGDGIGDGWEALNGLDPADASDLFDDPDNDGYDFNHNGKIDNYDDWVAPSDWEMPVNTDYTVITLSELLANLEEYDNTQVRIEDATILDPEKFQSDEIVFDKHSPHEYRCRMTVDFTDQSTVASVELCLEGTGNRPFEVEYDEDVDIQGIFRVYDGVYADVVIRGVEKFTNMMEYYFRSDHDDDGVFNETDPSNNDTDGDGMSDGWEIGYDLDPTWDGDAYIDLDSDAIQFGDEVRGYNLDEFLFGCDPRKADTDMDSYDINKDGWDPDDRNAIDFAEVFLYNSDPSNWDTDRDGMSDGWEIWYGLKVNEDDAAEDPDGDGFTNVDEYIYQTNPQDPDSHP